jgi:hypothetical protein
MGSPDYAALWLRLRSIVEGDAEYARDEAKRNRRVRSDNEWLDYHRYSAEADAMSRILAIMDEMAPEDAL